MRQRAVLAALGIQRQLATTGGPCERRRGSAAGTHEPPYRSGRRWGQRRIP